MMKVAVFQASAAHTGIEQRLETLTRQARKAAARQARLLIVPELYLSGYNIGEEAIRAQAQPADGAAAGEIARIARSAGIALLYGYAERDGDRIFNAAQLIDAHGRTQANHRKTHLFGPFEHATFAAGDEVVTLAQVDGLKVAVLICYEIEFPENARLAALADADLIAVPTALMTPYHFVASMLVSTRAYENQVFIAYANHCGVENTLQYLGASCIAAPDGQALVRADRHREVLLTAELDLDRRTRSEQLNPYLHDRRPSLYAGLSEPPQP